MGLHSQKLTWPWKHNHLKMYSLLLMAEILHQLRLVAYPIIYMVLYIPGGWEWDFSHQQY